ncbi:predicted protein [Nematostella vectensis]|uniref:Uncharacterized protein n=1 Tax=Nematostella vectensis TaxID=45351 RepID=A7RTC0_NEMVE|nr:predicted protein [Nematostella vectensis]|eukprot:XP_001637306.1 predicted protein [Nematostella vectensis]
MARKPSSNLVNLVLLTVACISPRFSECELEVSKRESLFLIENGVKSITNIYKSVYVVDAFECSARCMAEANCSSVNYHDGKAPMNLCEMIATTGQQLTTKASAHARMTRIENLCERDSCSARAKCHVVYGQETPSCECPAGFTGRDCELPKTMKIVVRSECTDDPGKIGSHGIALMQVDGKDFSINQRGHHVASFTMAGTLISKTCFDTYTVPSAGAEMRDYITALPVNTLILIAIRDTGNSFVTDAHAALRSIGAKDPLTPAFRASWWLIGHKGGSRDWVKQGGADQFKGPSGGNTSIPREGCFLNGHPTDKWCYP